MIVPRRLIAQTWSKASSVSSSKCFVAASTADSDIFVQDTDAPPAPRAASTAGERLFLGDVGGDGHAFATAFAAIAAGLVAEARAIKARQEGFNLNPASLAGLSAV